MADRLSTVNFNQLDALSVGDWIDKMNEAIKKVETTMGYELQEATLNIAAIPSASVKFGKKKPPPRRG